MMIFDVNGGWYGRWEQLSMRGSNDDSGGWVSEGADGDNGCEWIGDCAMSSGDDSD